MAVLALRLVFLTVFVAMVAGGGVLDTGDQDTYLEYLLRRTLEDNDEPPGAGPVKVDMRCVDAFEKLKMKHLYTWIIFKVSDDKTTIVPDVVDSGAHCFDEFLGKLKESGEPRYAVYDVHMKTMTGKDKNRMVFLVWIPESAGIKNKMIYTSSKDYLKKALKVVPELQAGEEISFKKDLVQRAMRGMKSAENIVPEFMDDCA